MQHHFEIDNSEKRIYNFLVRNNTAFSPNLDKKVDLLRYAKKMATHGTNIFVCIENDVGHACYYSNDEQSKKAYLSSICIVSRLKGRSLGSELLFLVESKAKQAGMETIGLQVNVQNKRAKDFYQRHGYKSIPSLYGAKEDVDMVKKLNN